MDPSPGFFSSSYLSICLIITNSRWTFYTLQFGLYPLWETGDIYWGVLLADSSKVLGNSFSRLLIRKVFHLMTGQCKSIGINTVIRLGPHLLQDTIGLARVSVFKGIQIFINLFLCLNVVLCTKQFIQPFVFFSFTPFDVLSAFLPFNFLQFSSNKCFILRTKLNFLLWAELI